MIHVEVKGQSSCAVTPKAFDPTLARYQVTTVPLEEVVDLLHVTHAADHVARYRDLMAGGSVFPPVSAVRLAGRILLADGHKRLCAARACGVRELPVEMWPWHRWWLDQAAQAVGHVRKTVRILFLLPTRPRAAGALAVTTIAHWWRVARSLALRARR